MQVASWLLDPGSKERTLHNMVTNFTPQDLSLLDGISPGQGVQSLGIGGDVSYSGRYRAAVECVLVYRVMAQLTVLLSKDSLLGSLCITSFKASIENNLALTLKGDSQY